MTSKPFEVRPFLPRFFLHITHSSASLLSLSLSVLPIFMHPLAKDTLAAAVDGSAELPMIGIGDALHALPPGLAPLATLR